MLNSIHLSAKQLGSLLNYGLLTFERIPPRRAVSELQKGEILAYFKRLYLGNGTEYGFNFWFVFILAIVEQLDKVSCKSELI